MATSWIKNKLNIFEESGYKYDLLHENQFESFDGILNYYEYQRINTKSTEALLSDMVKYDPVSTFWHGFNYTMNPAIFKTLEYEYKDLLRNFIVAPYHEFWWYMPRGLFMNIPQIGKRGGFLNTDLPVVGCMRGKLFSEVFFRCEFGERQGLYIPASYLMPEIPRFTVFRQSNWGYSGFLFGKSLFSGKFLRWDVGLTDGYRRFKILNSWYHGFITRRPLSEWGMRTNGLGLRTSSIIRQVYSKKSFLTVDCFAKLYFNRIVANKIFISLANFKYIDYNTVFNTDVVYKTFLLDINKLILREDFVQFYKMHYNNAFYTYSKFYTYFNALGSISAINRLHNINVCKYGLTHALIRYSKYNLSKNYKSLLKNNIVLYRNKLFRVRKKSRRAMLSLLNELRIINNKKHKILGKVRFYKDKYVKAGLQCLDNFNNYMEFVDELIISKKCKFNYFVYLLLKLVRRRNISKLARYIMRQLDYPKRLNKLERVCKKRKARYHYRHNWSRDISASNKFNINDNRALTKQLLFHDSLSDSIHLMSYGSHRNKIFRKPGLHIRLLKFSGLFNRNKNVSGVGRFYRVTFKPRRHYVRRFWFKNTRKYWLPKSSIKINLGNAKRNLSTWDHALYPNKRFTEFYRINRIALKSSGRVVFNKLFSFRFKKRIILNWMNYLAFITRTSTLLNYGEYFISSGLWKKYIYVLLYVLRRNKLYNSLRSNRLIFRKYFCRYPSLWSSYIKNE